MSETCRAAIVYDRSMFDTAHAISNAVRAGDTSAVACVERALERAHGDVNNAIVAICAEHARRDARAIDERVARGEDPGPLAGVPFTVKDTICTAGVATTAGSALFVGDVPAFDAPAVARLRAAGAVLVGKTNCPEFALQARTDNRLFGATRHPAAPSLSPGGSSGGCAAAVASGIVPFSIGGDYGGSIRYPATVTGCFGFRPARGALDASGTRPEPPPGSPRHEFQTVGPIARTLEDLMLVVHVLGVSADTPAVAPAVAPIPSALLEDAAVVFDAWRASDDYGDLRTLATGREQELTDHIRALLDASPRATDVGALRVRASELRCRCAVLMTTTPVYSAPIALAGASDADVDSLAFLRPSRAIALLGLPSLALPGNVQLAGRPGHEGDLFAAARTLMSAR